MQAAQAGCGFLTLQSLQMRVYYILGGSHEVHHGLSRAYCYYKLLSRVTGAGVLHNKRLMPSIACFAMQSVGSSPAAQKWAAKPDAKAAVQLLPAESEKADKGCVSRSEGSSPTAAGQKGSAWTGQISHAVLTSAAKSPQPQASPPARGVAQRPASAQPSSQTPRTQQ